MRLLLLFISSFLVHTIFAQSPGGVTSGLALWFKGNTGTIGSPISSWEDQSGNMFDANQGTPASRPILVSNGMNYNNTIDFDGNSDFLPITTKSYSGTAALNGLSVFTVFRTDYSGGGNNDNWAFLDYDRSDFFNFYLRGNGSLGFSYRSGSIVDNYAPTTGFNNDVPHIGSAIYNASEVNDTQLNIDGREDFLQNRTATGSTVGRNTTRFGFIGDGSEAANFNGGRNNIYYDGQIAEVICYENVNLSVLDIQKIHSYLAVKYAVTLDNSGGATAGNYVSSNGTTVWTASAGPTYHNDVIGVARDDSQGLLQLQSTTLDDTSHVYLSTLAATNSANGGSFNSDLQYLLIGDNAGRMCATAASDLERPSGISSRIEREWKVTNTDFNGQFSVDWLLAPCANAPTIVLSDLRLLVDDDGDFSDATSYGTLDGLTFTNSGGRITISGISTVLIARGSTQYLTLASVNTTLLPIELISFEANTADAKTVDITWSTSSERDNDFFTVEKSENLTDWISVGQLPGTGNSTNILNYSMKDISPYSGVSYYRLAQTDFDGTTTLSQLEKITIDISKELTVSPNPTSGMIYLKGMETLNDFQSMDIYSLNGKKVATFTELKSSYELSDLTEGVYFLQLTLSNQIKTVRFIKQ